MDEDDGGFGDFISKALGAIDGEFKAFVKKEFRKTKHIVAYIGLGMTECPNCDEKILEVVHDSGPDYPFPHVDVTYSCKKCGFYTHYTLDRDPEWVAKAYKPPLDLSKYL